MKAQNTIFKIVQYYRTLLYHGRNDLHMKPFFLIFFKLNEYVVVGKVLSFKIWGQSTQSHCTRV